MHVAIRDGVSWETERLRRCATIGLGPALLSRLTDGIGWKMLSVNTHRPLFWFLGTADVTSMADLRGRRLAVHAAHTAPGCFARIVLRKHGLNPDRDLECVVRLRVTTQDGGWHRSDRTAASTRQSASHSVGADFSTPASTCSAPVNRTRPN